MTKLATIVLASALAPAAALAADPALLGMVMPGARVVAGIRVDAAKRSPFGQYVLAHMRVDDENFAAFFSETGFDPRRDVTDLVIASDWAAGSNGRWLVLARGFFQPSRISAAVQSHGGAVSSFSGVNLLSGTGSPGNGSPSVLAFLDTSNAAMGDPDSVKAAVRRFQAGDQSASVLANRKIQDLMAANDFWFYCAVPLSEFAGVMPDANLSDAMRGNLLQGINQVSGGVKFGGDVRFSAEAVTRSEKDAGALVDVLRFLAGLVQLNRDKGGVAADVSSLADSMELKTSGNVTSVSFVVPESQLEKLFDSARPVPKAAARK